MLGILNKFLDSNEKQIKKLQPQVDDINSLEKKFEKLTDEKLLAKTAEFKLRHERGESLDDLLPEAYATVRESAKRTLNLRHYDVQLIAGIALHMGMIAEQRTGEGKTLTATLPLYLNSLAGKNVQLATVNDYLARIGVGWMGPIYSALGVSVGVVMQDAAHVYDPKHEAKNQLDWRLRHLKPVSKKEAYQADITYGTNNEFGFDYLRDNMVWNLDDMAQRGQNYVIVDEADSILIDEARTPLIISAPSAQATDKYSQFSKLVEELSAETDYVIDEKLKTANLTEHGITKVEKRLGVTNLYEKDFSAIHHIQQALRAKTLFFIDRDYVVKDNQIVIVDEFTGRLMPGRRWSEGLHQAIEAKEGVGVQQESQTLATISFQNFFRLYDKLAGMTGTAVTEAEEFHKIYSVEALVVPTNKPMVRKDESDVVYKTAKAKFTAIANEVGKRHEENQPVLIGTTSIEKNEFLASLLKKKKIPHQLLNAKNHQREAEIIAEAGKIGSVTLATNIAGRGVDIILGGTPPTDKHGRPTTKGREYEKWKKNHEEVKSIGGLHVIGTERHESRRIDNQLRGRAGRQGDPGSTKFYVALEDDIMRLFGGDQIARIMTAFKLPEDTPIEHSMVAKAIENAQVKVETHNFDIRKHLVEYDDVANKQREIIYSSRREILEATKGKDESSKVKDELLSKVEREIENLVLMYAPEGVSITEHDQIAKEFSTIIPFDQASQQKLVEDSKKITDSENLIKFYNDVATKVYKDREKSLAPEVVRDIEKFVNLSVIDTLWTEHLDTLDDLREGIGLRAAGQRDPLVEYKQEAFSLFEKLISSIDYEIVRRIFKVQVRQQPEIERIEERGVEVHPQASLVGDVNQQPAINNRQSPAVLANAAGLQQSSDKDPLAMTDEELEAEIEKLEGQQTSENTTTDDRDPNEMSDTELESEIARLEAIENQSSRSLLKSSKGETLNTPLKVTKIGRNDPCPCGSGLKWKKCGLINAPQHKG
ncbi:MAG: preprotein translocase subunit SecA [Candidatus Curtissbacteria bacterium]|nr:preprotein translocase subunit SecA [Candidatus Curtissbacteria bacterium]